MANALLVYSQVPASLRTEDQTQGNKQAGRVQLWFVQVWQEKHPDWFSHKTWCWQKKKKERPQNFKVPHPANSLLAEFTASISNLLPVGLQPCLNCWVLKASFYSFTSTWPSRLHWCNGWKIKDPYYNLKLHVLGPLGKSLSRMSGWLDFY